MPSPTSGDGPGSTVAKRRVEMFGPFPFSLRGGKIMNRLLFTSLGFLAILAGGLLTMRLVAQTPQSPPKDAPAPDHQISSPHTHDNLTIFLVTGEDKLKCKKFLTLPEALEQKKVIVYKTCNVNPLTNENLSPNEE